MIKESLVVWIYVNLIFLTISIIFTLITFTFKTLMNINIKNLMLAINIREKKNLLFILCIHMYICLIFSLYRFLFRVSLIVVWICTMKVIFREASVKCAKYWRGLSTIINQTLFNTNSSYIKHFLNKYTANVINHLGFTSDDIRYVTQCCAYTRELRFPLWHSHVVNLCHDLLSLWILSMYGISFRGSFWEDPWKSKWHRRNSKK